MVIEPIEHVECYISYSYFMKIFLLEVELLSLSIRFEFSKMNSPISLTYVLI